MSGRLGDDLMLCNVSVANLPLQEVIPAAAAAGFACISILARAHRRAVERDGLTTADIRTLVIDNGMWVQDVEAAGDWLAGAAPDSPVPDPEKAWMDPVYGTGQLLDLAGELDARTLVATHFGAAVAPDVAASAFADLCDEAATADLRVALEFPAMATVGDVGQAWEIVRLADRANGGLLFDNWHHRRSAGTDEDLAEVPPERVFSVQLSDGTRDPIGPPVEDVVHRRLPGDGDLDVAAFLAALDGRGVRCPVGIEVLHRDIVGEGSVAASKLLFESLRATVEAAR